MFCSDDHFSNTFFVSLSIRVDPASAVRLPVRPILNLVCRALAVSSKSIVSMHTHIHSAYITIVTSHVLIHSAAVNALINEETCNYLQTELEPLPNYNW